MSKLEKFINNNRSEFDDLLPPDKLWQKLESSLAKKTGKQRWLGPFTRWSIAAAVLAMVAAGAFILIRKPAPTQAAITQPSDTAVADLITLAPEEAPEMNQFAKLIAGKQEELKVLATEQPVLYKKFSQDIIILDSSYNNLKKKLSATPNREMLIEAMIQNLQLQLNVLNQQLSIIHQIKQSKKNGHEKNKSYT